MSASARCRGDAGQVAGIEALPFGVLIFVVGALLVTNVWGVIDAKLAMASAAREAARAYVEAPDAATAADAAAAAAAEAVDAHGRTPERLSLSQSGEPFARCARVTFEASYPVPAIVLPWVGGFGEAFTAKARHSEVVDPFRSGLDGTASCVD